MIRLERSNSNELMSKWFALVTEKNKLLRTENKLMVEQRQLQLQVMDEQELDAIIESFEVSSELSLIQSYYRRKIIVLSNISYCQLLKRKVTAMLS